MIPNLTPEEETSLRELLGHHGRGIRSLSITSSFLLLAGGLAIVGTALYLSQHLTDAAAYSVGLPNFIGGILLLGGYIVLSKRVAQLKKITSLLSKLSGIRVVM